MNNIGTFTKGGRNWQYTADGKIIGIYYVTTDKAEYERVRTTVYPNENGQSVSGSRYSAEIDGNYYIQTSYYEKQPDGSFKYFYLGPGKETSNGNAAQARSIESDVSLKQQITGTSTNTTPTNPNQPGPGGGSTPISKPNNPPPQSSDILKYPLKMSDDQDRIMFHAHKYESGNRSGAAFGQLNSVNYSPISQKVFLSIQSPISDQNSVGWEPDTMNPLEVEAAKVSRELMKSEGISDITATASEAMRKAIANSKVHEESIRTFLVGQAIGVNNLYSRLEGQVLNPNLELLFQGPQLRPFNFTFKLSAREPDEADSIKQIIRYFKENMAVRKDNFVFLKAPNVFKIQYQYGNNTTHKSLNLIKMCALTNCSVDYTPLGSYMTYDDVEHTMVAYTLSLAFQELEPIYDTDYKEFKYGEGETVQIPSQNSIGA